jgi:methyl-accepting chemotaxis protein
MSATDLQARLESLASELENIDGDAADRLRDISEALDDGPRRRELAHLDVRSILDPQGIEERAVIQRRPAWLSWLEWLRNVLVLFPIAFTWIGLSQASANYSLVVTQNPDLVNQPFLLLWERGFQELGQHHFPTFSELALVDFVVLFVVIGLTVVVHRWRDVQETQAERKAAELRSRIEQTVWELDQHLAAERSSQDINRAALRVGDAVERFRVHADELLDLMLAEHRRLEETEASRSREIDDLEVFTGAATQLVQYGQSVEHTYERLQASVDRFTDEIQKAGQQQELLLRSLDSSDIGSHQMTEAVRTLRQSLATTIGELGNAAARSGDSVSRITAAMDEMADLASRLVEEDTALRKALLETREANREILKSLQVATGEVRETTSVNQLAASTLRQAVNELGKLIQSSGGLAHQLSQSAGQMSGVAENLSATTYQATSQLKSATNVNQQAVSTLSQVAAELTKLIRSNGDLSHRLSQSAEQMSHVVDNLGATTGATATTFKDLQPVVDQLRGAIGLFSQETRRLGETIGSAEQGGSRLLFDGENLSRPAPARRSRALLVGLGVVFGLTIAAGVDVLIWLGLLPVLR